MSAPTAMIARNWRDLIRPKAITVDEYSTAGHYAKFVCEPLERGFGITLGNALRRVLLSSLQGAAITAVRIDGALHEFTSVPDVIEDVTDIDPQPQGRRRAQRGLGHGHCAAPREGRPVRRFARATSK